MYSMIGLVNACISIFMSLAPIAGGGLMSIGVERKLCGCRGDHRSGGTAGIVVPAGNEERKTPFDLKAIVGSYARLTASFQFMRLSLIPSLFFAAYMVFIASSAFLYRETFAFSLSAFVVHFLLSWRHFQSPASFPPVLSPHLVAIGALKIGMALAIVSILALLTATTPWAITLLMSLFCFGFSICYPTLFARSMSVYPEIYGVAASIL